MSVQSDYYIPMLAEADTKIRNLSIENERLRAALKPFAELGRELNAAGKAAWPDGASAQRLRMDGIEARHFREAADAVQQLPQSEKP